jgi:uncharacterized membrane protein (UPF0136 family)
MFQLGPLVFSFWSVVAAAVVSIVGATMFCIAAILSEWAGGRTWRNIVPSAYHALLMAFPCALIGFVVGYLTGNSRVAAIGAVVPAILTLIGGLGAYVFGRDSQNRNAIGYIICIFVVSLLIGTENGANTRGTNVEARLTFAFETERRLRNTRANLSLPEEVPAWIVKDGDDKSD